MDVVVQHVVDLGSQRVVELLHLVLHVVLGVFGVALELLLLVVDGLGTRGALGFAQLVALSLQLLGQGFDLVAQSLELRRLGWYFFCRSAKLRWPSLVWATATWKAMTAILAGPAGAVAAGAASGIGSGGRLGGGAQGKA